MGPKMKTLCLQSTLIFLLMTSLIKCVRTNHGCVCPVQVTCTNMYPDVLDMVRPCGWKSLVLLTDDIVLADVVLRLLTDLHIALYHLDLSDQGQVDLQRKIRQAYVDQWKNYLVVMTSPHDVISAAEAVFQNESRQHAAAMPHKSQWIFLLWTDDQYNHVINGQNESSFDNVALIRVNGDHFDYKRKVEFSDFKLMLKPGLVFTSMWKPDRIREYQRIDPDKIADSCWIFPNARNGLNQRKLEILTKQDLGEIVTVNVETNQYEGYLIDLLPEMAQTLNFTYVLLPDAKYDMNMTWNDHFHAVSYGHVDLGLSMWTEQPLLNESKVKVTSAIIHDVSTGVYKQPCPSPSLYLVFPFSSPVYIILIFFLFFATALYMFVDYVTTTALRKDVLSQIEQDEVRGYPKLHRVHRSLGFLNRRTCLDVIASFWEKPSDESIRMRVVGLLGAFSASVVNQTYLPFPRFTSLRLIVCFWYINMVLFYAIYTSNLTADIVTWEKKLPFYTYEELVENEEYRWATFALTYNQTYYSAIKSHPFYTLNQRMKVADYNMDTIEKLLNDKYVLLYGEKLMKLVLSRSALFPDLVFMENKLLQASFGLILPMGSDLQDMFSSALVKMYQSGLVEQYIGKHVPQESFEEKKKERGNSVVLRDVMLPFLLILGLVALSLLCLIIEGLYSWVVALYTLKQ